MPGHNSSRGDSKHKPAHNQEADEEMKPHGLMEYVINVIERNRGQITDWQTERQRHTVFISNQPVHFS